MNYPSNLPKRFLSLFLSCLLLFKTVPIQAVTQESLLNLKQVIQKDLKSSPLPKNIPNGSIKRLYSVKGRLMEVEIDLKGSEQRILSAKSYQAPWQELKGQPAKLPSQSTIQDAIAKEVLKQERDQRTKLFGSKDRWRRSDNIAHLLVHDPKEGTTMLYEGIYRNDAGGEPEIVSQQVFSVSLSEEVLTQLQGADADQGIPSEGVSMTVLIIKEEKERVYDSDPYDEDPPNAGGYRVVERVITKTIKIPQIHEEEGSREEEGVDRRKPDIQFVDHLIKKYKLDWCQRRLLHNEITGQHLSEEEIEEIARDIAQTGRGKCPPGRGS